ncbi:glycosyltransferase [Patescibacteria group bacterium]|nr:glycosyltransferase [Patescibacteria group bacterium]
MEAPRYSVIIPALNEERFLPTLLASLAIQHERDFEVVVVDGHSRDRTVAVARSFTGKLPSLSVLESPRASLPLQRNIGAERSRGAWLVFADADSVFLPYFLERIRSYIDTEHPVLFTTWFRPDSEVGSDAVLTLLGNLFVEGSILFKRQLSPGPLTIVTREAFGRVGGYDERLSFGEDFDFAQRLAGEKIPMTMLRETLYIWSMRRIRKEGKLRMLQFYAKVSLRALLMKKPPKDVPDYIMGGQLYRKGYRKPKKTSALKKAEKNVQKLVEEIIGKDV